MQIYYGGVQGTSADRLKNLYEKTDRKSLPEKPASKSLLETSVRKKSEKVSKIGSAFVRCGKRERKKDERKKAKEKRERQKRQRKKAEEKQNNRKSKRDKGKRYADGL